MGGASAPSVRVRRSSQGSSGSWGEQAARRPPGHLNAAEETSGSIPSVRGRFFGTPHVFSSGSHDLVSSGFDRRNVGNAEFGWTSVTFARRFQESPARSSFRRRSRSTTRWSATKGEGRESRKGCLSHPRRIQLPCRSGKAALERLRRAPAPPAFRPSQSGRSGGRGGGPGKRRLSGLR